MSVAAATDCNILPEWTMMSMLAPSPNVSEQSWWYMYIICSACHHGYSESTLACNGGFGNIQMLCVGHQVFAFSFSALTSH